MMPITFSSCRLYSWMRLICTSNIESGSTETPVKSWITLRQLQLVLTFDLLELLAELGVVSKGLQVAQLAQDR